MFRCITCLESNLTIDVGSRTLTMLENCSLVGAAVPFEVQLGKGLFRCPYRSTPIKSLTTFLFSRNYNFYKSLTH